MQTYARAHILARHRIHGLAAAFQQDVMLFAVWLAGMFLKAVRGRSGSRQGSG